MKRKSNGRCFTCGGIGFITRFRHWRSGKMIYAKNYGIKAFPVRCRCSRRRSK